MTSGLLIVIGLALSGLASLAVYANTTFIDRDGFIDTFDSVVADPALVNRVGESFNTDFEEAGASALREGQITLDDIDFEALGIPTEDETGEPLSEEELLTSLQAKQADALRYAVDSAVNRPDFAQSFRSALGGAHDDFIDALDNDTSAPTVEDGEIYLSLDDTYGLIVDRLEDEPAATQIVTGLNGSQLGSMKVGDLTTTTNATWRFLRFAQNWTWVLVFFCGASFLGAILLTERRPQAIMAIGFGTAFLALIILVVAYGTWGVVPVMTKGGASGDLVSAVVGRAIQPLLRTEVIVIIAGSVTGIIGWLLRWVWPDDWVYAYYDDGTGRKAVARRASPEDIEAANREAAKAFPSGPGFGAPAEAHGAPRWDRDDEWSTTAGPAQVDSEIEFPSNNQSVTLAADADVIPMRRSGSSTSTSSSKSGDDGDSSGWDYGDSSW